LEQALVEIASGPINMMWLQEWHDWFHYLLGRLIPRSQEKGIYEYLVEDLVTAFLSLYPRGIVGEPYAGFRSDILRTLAVCNIDDSLWKDGEIRVGAMLWESKDGRQVANCRTICGDFSCLMFFCMKYLDAAQIADWVSSVFRINCQHWRAQLMIWLIGVHGMLTGSIAQPSQFPESRYTDLSPSWAWSHVINGGYFERGGNGYVVLDFIPSDNLAAFNRAIRETITERLFFEWLAGFEQHPHLKDNLFELPKRFADIYLPARPQP
jgi:hypothetical protein